LTSRLYPPPPRREAAKVYSLGPWPQVTDRTKNTLSRNAAQANRPTVAPSIEMSYTQLLTNGLTRRTRAQPWIAN